VLRGGPEAQRRAKQLFLEQSPLPSAALEAITTAAIADARASGEARAGIEAFLARRDPPWVSEDPTGS
jgi:methylglutaconyl-CoA hydratase